MAVKGVPFCHPWLLSDPAYDSACEHIKTEAKQS